RVALLAQPERAQRAREPALRRGRCAPARAPPARRAFAAASAALAAAGRPRTPAAARQLAAAARARPRHTPPPLSTDEAPDHAQHRLGRVGLADQIGG